jgi:hypothetical protein
MFREAVTYPTIALDGNVNSVNVRLSRLNVQPGVACKEVEQ